MSLLTAFWTARAFLSAFWAATAAQKEGNTDPCEHWFADPTHSHSFSGPHQNMDTFSGPQTAAQKAAPARHAEYNCICVRILGLDKPPLSGPRWTPLQKVYFCPHSGPGQANSLWAAVKFGLASSNKRWRTCTENCASAFCVRIHQQTMENLHRKVHFLLALWSYASDSFLGRGAVWSAGPFNSKRILSGPRTNSAPPALKALADDESRSGKTAGKSVPPALKAPAADRLVRWAHTQQR